MLCPLLLFHCFSYFQDLLMLNATMISFIGCNLGSNLFIGSKWSSNLKSSCCHLHLQMLEQFVFHLLLIFVCFWNLMICMSLNYRIEIDTKLPLVGDQKWVIWICSFNVPMAPGKTRSIVCSARNFFQFTMPGPAWWQVRYILFSFRYNFDLWQ